MNVKLLLDENLSPTIAATLCREDGVDAVHVRDRGLLGVSDHVLLERAFLDDRVLVTCNVDDFIGFARSREIHAGIVLVEEGGLLRDEQLHVVRAAIATLRVERAVAQARQKSGRAGHDATRASRFSAPCLRHGGC